MGNRYAKMCKKRAYKQLDRGVKGKGKDKGKAGSLARGGRVEGGGRRAGAKGWEGRPDVG